MSSQFLLYKSASITVSKKGMTLSMTFDFVKSVDVTSVTCSVAEVRSWTSVRTRTFWTELKFSSGSGSGPAFDSDVRFKVQAYADFFEPTLNTFEPEPIVSLVYLKKSTFLDFVYVYLNVTLYKSVYNVRWLPQVVADEQINKKIPSNLYIFQWSLTACPTPTIVHLPKMAPLKMPTTFFFLIHLATNNRSDTSALMTTLARQLHLALIFPQRFPFLNER